MKLSRRAGATSQILQVFIQDSSSTTGAGLTGLVFNTSGLTAYYHRDTDTTATAISLVTMTVGTFTSSGLKEIDATNMPGFYQFCPPNAALAAGASSAAFHLKGAANMAPLPVEIDLDSQVDVYLWNGTTVFSPATAGIPDVNVKNMNNVAAAYPVAITSNVKKNQGLNGFQFVMSDSTLHQPKTGVTVTATRSLDGGAFGACANSATEISSGWYQINLANTDLNANTVALRFTGTGCDDTDVQFVTQP